MTDQIQIAQPATIAALSEQLANFTGSVTYIAGGTDLLIAFDHGPKPDLLIDITGLSELTTISTGNNVLRIGAATPVSDLINHPLVARGQNALSQAARQIGSVQIRNRATLGGNIASAMPAGDFLPVLMCLDARIEVLQRGDSIANFTIDEIIIGSRTTCLKNGDLITAINIPLTPNANQISAFGKTGRRQELTIARLNLAVCATLDASSSHIKEICITIGAIGPKPVRLASAEKVLAGRKIDQSFADDFINLLIETVNNAIPGRLSHAYKRRAITGLGLDVLTSLFNRPFEVPVTLEAVA